MSWVGDVVLSRMHIRLHCILGRASRSQQRLEIDPNDCDTVYIFPDPTVSTLGDVYAKHAWRRKR